MNLKCWVGDSLNTGAPGVTDTESPQALLDSFPWTSLGDGVQDWSQGMSRQWLSSWSISGDEDSLQLVEEQEA